MRKNVKIKVKKTRRGRRKKTKNFSKNLRFLGVNAGGLRPKLSTLKKILSELKPSVFLIEETKYKEEGKLKLNSNYVIFESVRKSKDGGGGLAVGCDKSLHPVFLREGDGNVEALSVSISVREMKIRCCVAYGPQETDLIDKKDYEMYYRGEEEPFYKSIYHIFIIYLNILILDYNISLFQYINLGLKYIYIGIILF